MWSRSGRELYFESFRSIRMMAVSVQPGAVFTYGQPQPLFDMTPYSLLGGPGRRVDVAADGRFLITKPFGTEGPIRQGLVVVSHWFEEVKARVK